MGCFIVEPCYGLSGSIRPQGNKNEALPILAASLLSSEEIILDKIPKILDVQNMLKIIESLDANVSELGEHQYKIVSKNINTKHMNQFLIQQLRGSLTLIAPLLVKLGYVKFPRPGGDKIGRRRIDTHLFVFESLGAKIEVHPDYYEISCDKLKGTNILLDEASVTATENAIMAATFAKGTTILRNAASEPHVQQVCHFINQLGGQIEGIGSNLLTIQGVDRLHGGSHRIASDYLEVGSFIGLAAVTNSEIQIEDVELEHLHTILAVFEKMGIHTIMQNGNLMIPKNQRLKIVSDYHGAIRKIDDAPWPGFPADLMSIALVVATQCEGITLIFEKMFESRLFFTDKLISMGAKIVLCDPHRAVIIGPSKLNGADLVSPDIRAGVALLIAALCARGNSKISNVIQIDRGYEQFDVRLNQLGANIQRVHDEN